MPLVEKYQENLNAALQTTYVIDIIQMEEFYFQKAKDKFNEFLGINITNVDVTGMIEVTTRKKYKYSYIGTLNSYDSNSVDYNFLLTVGQLITYCDTNGANKHEFNEYTDKRAISRANVRQNNWVRWLIEFKRGTDINLMPTSIKNTIQYLQNPESNLNISSDDWRKKILKALFQNENGNLFEEMHNIGVVANNPLNNGVLYSAICGSDPIKPIWATELNIQSPKVETPTDITFWLGGAWHGDEPNQRDVSKELTQNGVYAIDFEMGDISSIVSDKIKLNEWIQSIQKSGARDAFSKMAKMKPGDRIAIKSFNIKTQLLRIKAIGTIVDGLNSYVFDGKLGHTIPVQWEQVDLMIDYKISGYTATIHKVSKMQDINQIFFGEDSQDDNSIRETMMGYVFKQLGGLLKTYTIMTRTKLFELNCKQKLYICFSKHLPSGRYFYGFPKAIIDDNYGIDFLVLIRGNEGFYKIPFDIIKDLCLKDLLSLGKKPEQYKINLTLSNEIGLEYEIRIPGDRQPISVDEYYISFSNSYSKNDFLSEVFFDSDYYDEIVELINRKKNIILQGAPGVGKSYMAKRLAYSIIGEKDDNKVNMIQFHQSYSYEDFIEGYRPSGDGGFTLEPGVFYDFCTGIAKTDEANYISCINSDDEEVRKEADKFKYFFIIDEINRGRIEKIMGELMFLLENDKRGEEFSIKLTYSGENFYVPKNVFIIGMMNTADRSLAMMDYALRRRFSFVPISPVFENDGFINYIKKDDAALGEKILSEMKALNIDIKNDLGSGFQIGHSFLCNCNKITEDWYRSVLKYEIIPLLDEYWFDNEKQHSKWVKGLLPDA